MTKRQKKKNILNQQPKKKKEQIYFDNILQDGKEFIITSVMHQNEITDLLEIYFICCFIKDCNKIFYIPINNDCLKEPELQPILDLFITRYTPHEIISAIVRSANKIYIDRRVPYLKTNYQIGFLSEFEQDVLYNVFLLQDFIKLYSNTNIDFNNMLNIDNGWIDKKKANIEKYINIPIQTKHHLLDFQFFVLLDYPKKFKIPLSLEEKCLKDEELFTKWNNILFKEKMQHFISIKYLKNIEEPIKKTSLNIEEIDISQLTDKDFKLIEKELEKQELTDFLASKEYIDLINNIEEIIKTKVPPYINYYYNDMNQILYKLNQKILMNENIVIFITNNYFASDLSKNINNYYNEEVMKNKKLYIWNCNSDTNKLLEITNIYPELTLYNYDGRRVPIEVYRKEQDKEIIIERISTKRDTCIKYNITTYSLNKMLNSGICSKDGFYFRLIKTQNSEI